MLNSSSLSKILSGCLKHTVWEHWVSIMLQSAPGNSIPCEVHSRAVQALHTLSESFGYLGVAKVTDLEKWATASVLSVQQQIL